MITLISAFIGIYCVNEYTKKTGKQSIILVLLVFCLGLAFVSIPLKAFVM